MDNSGMSEKNIVCSIGKAQNETEQFRKDIGLIFVINGHIHVCVEDNDFLVGSEEFLLINSNKRHYTYVDEEALICRMDISYDMLSNTFEDDYIAFWCNSITAEDPGYEELRSSIREIILLKLLNDKADGFRLMEQYGRFLDTLTRNYRINIAGSKKNGTYEEADRVSKMLNYINIHYKEPISLVGLARKMFVSVSTLSRDFKKATGLKFPDYINQTRIRFAAFELLNSNNSVTDIAMNSGFSSPSSFNRVFKDVMGVTPTQYKRSVRGVIRRKEAVLSEEDASKVKQYLDANSVTIEKSHESSVTDIFQDEIKPFDPLITKAVSLGAFYQLTSSSVQEQIKRLVEQTGIKYIRMWNIFSPKCMIALSPDAKELSFEQVDLVLDFIVGIHAHPFLDMTDHPECIIQNGRKLYFKQEDSMGFESLKQWSFFLKELMDHVVFRYGRKEVSNWIFEFGDYSVESDPVYYKFGSAYYKDYDYKDVFKASYDLIKETCPGAMVGGPDWVMDGKPIDIEGYFSDWEQTGIYPDFYSVHIFPYAEEHKEDKTDEPDSERNMDPDFMKNQILDIRSRLKRANAPLRPLFVTEITSVLSNRNALNDHLSRGTNVLRVANIFQGFADMVCFWVATDRLSSNYAPSGILHGGSGLMSKDGIPKPSFYAVYFLSKLGDELLSRNDGYLAVRNGPDNIYVLCYNHKQLIYDYKFEEENTVNVHNVDSMFDDTEDADMSFMIHGLEPGKEYVVKKHTVSRECGSIMDEWQRLGYETNLRSNEIAYLKNICVPRIQMEHRIAEEGRIFLEAVLKAHEMLLFHIYR